MTSAVIMMFEYVKLEQPLNFVEELRVLSVSLLHFLQDIRTPSEKTPVASDIAWVEHEMINRSRTFGACTLFSHAFLLMYSSFSVLTPGNFSLPCSENTWTRGNGDPVGENPIIDFQCDDNVVSLFERFLGSDNPEDDQRQPDFARVVPDPQTAMVMISCAMQRVQLLRDMWEIPSLTAIATSEYRRTA